MLCTYLSIDEVNQDWAEKLAIESGVELDSISPRDLSPENSDCLLVDLDSLPAGYGKTVLADLLAGKREGPAAVHSYHLRRRDARLLRRRGVIVSRRLEPEVFRRLRKASASHKKEKSAPRCPGVSSDSF
jgi:hypothetical protein